MNEWKKLAKRHLAAYEMQKFQFFVRILVENLNPHTGRESAAKSAQQFSSAMQISNHNYSFL